MSVPYGHVDHLLWVVHPERAARYVEELSALFETEFDHLDGPARGGSSNVYVSWGAGIELQAIEPTDDPRYQEALADVAARGEGLRSVVVRVEDVRMFAQRARGLGYEVSEVVQGDDPQARRDRLSGWTRAVEDIQEVVVCDFLGTRLIVGQVDYASERAPVDD